jgi:hypothetical protein
MSAQYIDHESSHYLARYPQQDPFKVSRDDLIDEPPSPYSASAQHKVYVVPTSPTETRRGLSYPLDQLQSYSSEATTKASTEVPSSTSRSYLPSLSTADTEIRGLWKTILPESIACRLYVITVLVQTTVDLVIEGDLLVRFHEAEPIGNVVLAHKMPVYLTIFAIAHVFQLVMAVDAVYARNTLQFLCLTIFNALFLVYALIQISEIQSSVQQIPTLISDGISHIPLDVLTTILPIVIAVAELAYIALGWKIYHEFGWKIYKFLGADRQIKKLYAKYQIFQCLIKFDVFFWVGFSVQFISLVLLQKRDWEFYITCAALPASLVLLVEGHLAARHENKVMMITFMSGCVGAMVYFVYKLFKVIKYRTEYPFSTTWKSLATFSLIAISLLVITFVFAIIVLRNFGRGLKETIERSKVNASQTSHYGLDLHRRGMSKTINRMSIE